ncbi:unnamed protein product [Cuscuta europaea]|uniref:PPM-type phosphatase domain-containing protein n=1 Tax=Cuscuta europaea TaxID=41803 RepID=A0A9P1ENK1_CUSEU|nr:unnamed protein product [Cuscuta europaea]
MGGGFSSLLPCVNPALNRREVEFTPLDETLGHSFCYVRSSARSLSPPHSDRFLSPSHSLRFDHPPPPPPAALHRHPDTAFRAISGASVSANTSTPTTLHTFSHDAAADGSTSAGTGSRGTLVDGFQSTSSFCALPLQPIPRAGSGREPPPGPIDRAFFMSGPIERGALSGPLDSLSNTVPFSAPLSAPYVNHKKGRRRRSAISRIPKALYRNFPDKKRTWLLPVKHSQPPPNRAHEQEMLCHSNVQWALGKAGEDRVHVVVSEEHGWLFVGIYDGFNGPDAPEFLMSNLYKAMFKNLEGLFWDNLETAENPLPETSTVGDKGSTKRVTFHSKEIVVRRRRLWEYLAEDHPEEGLDLSGSDRFAFSVEDAISLSNAAGSSVKRSKLKHGLSIKHMDGKKLFPWRSVGVKGKENSGKAAEVGRGVGNGRRRKVGPVDHELVLGAMSEALEMTENAYLDMTDKLLDQYPELALMGSCLLVVLMRDEDVYVMNVGDSRAIVAKYEPPPPPHQQAVASSSSNSWVPRGNEDAWLAGEAVAEEEDVSKGGSIEDMMRLTTLQLSTDHSTGIEEEVIRIKNEHPDDNNCIVNDRVKGRLKVTRAFGAGSLKQDWNYMSCLTSQQETEGSTMMMSLLW